MQYATSVPAPPTLANSHHRAPTTCSGATVYPHWQKRDMQAAPAGCHCPELGVTDVHHMLDGEK